MFFLCVPHGAAGGLLVLVWRLVASVTGAAFEWGRGAVTVDGLQAHRPLHRPWSCIGSGRARLRQPHNVNLFHTILAQLLNNYRVAHCFTAELKYCAIIHPSKMLFIYLFIAPVQNVFNWGAKFYVFQHNDIYIVITRSHNLNLNWLGKGYCCYFIHKWEKAEMEEGRKH